MSKITNGFVTASVDNARVIRFVCARCDAHTDIRLRSSEKMNPEAFANHVKLRGWVVDAFRASVNRCPDCAAGRNKTKNDVDSELRKFQEKLPMPNLTPDPTIVRASPVMPIREPTSDQRVMVRQLLEANFDEEGGYYVGSFSDQKIAEVVNVPRLVVERIREAAYGPIRITPEVLALRREAAELRKLITDARAAADALIAEITASLTPLDARLAVMERTLAESKAA